MTTTTIINNVETNQTLSDINIYITSPQQGSISNTNTNTNNNNTTTQVETLLLEYNQTIKIDERNNVSIIMENVIENKKTIQVETLLSNQTIQIGKRNNVSIIMDKNNTVAIDNDNDDYNTSFFIYNNLSYTTNYTERMECLLYKQNSFTFQPLVFQKKNDFTLLSTVQSISNDGPTGLPQRCDWVIGKRYTQTRRIDNGTVWGNISIYPKIIFIQTQNIQVFHDNILKCLNADERFIIIIGDCDMTTPRQTDKRFQKRDTYKIWNQWLNDPRIIHIFVEHLDEWNHTKVTPIPLGMNPKDAPLDIMQLDVDSIINRFPVVVPIQNRTLKVRLTNRQRDGNQFAYRRKVRDLCNTTWQNYCVYDKAPNGRAYYRDIVSYPFILCVHGGGIDPNPQAWTALIVGTIPIIERFAGDSIYNNLPVLLVDKISELNLTTKNLRKWRDERVYYFEEPYRTNYTKKLMTDYWWNIIISKLL